MSYTFTKLFSGLTESTVWVEPYPTRILWVSMLSWADKRGRVFGSVPGIARRAGINMDEAEAALVSFLSPDRHSRTPEHEGRRIETIDGGWRLLNYSKYRELRDHDDRLEYQREWDRRNRPERFKSDKNPTNPTKIRPPPTQAEAEADIKPNYIVRQKAPDPSLLAEKAERREAAMRVLAFLNERAGRAFKPVPETLKPIMARLASGATEGQCRQVIARKLSQWGGDSRMEAYLRPKTLFGPENFANYQGELVVPKESHA